MNLRARLALTVAAAMLATLAPLAPASANPGQQEPVFINEIHYDNDSTDSGEAVEIAGPEGTSLTGWDLVLYNGSNGSQYDTDPLPSSIGESGVVVVNYPSNGIQNGAPDGLALVDGTDEVVQFLSYEGTLTAAGGPANGMTSTDIGRVEAGTEPAGQSLQLTGTGDTYDDFTWSGPADDSFGAINSGQTLGGEQGGEPPPPLDPGACGDGFTPTYEVQGSGAESPLVGDEVSVEGVVVGDFQGGESDDGDLDGFFIQDPAGDGSADTSDGLFVFDADAAAVDEGDRVRVTGTVAEFFGLTELTDVTDLTLCTEDAGAPAPTPVSLPADDGPDGVDGRERYEGMAVTFPAALGRHGEPEHRRLRRDPPGAGRSTGQPDRGRRAG